MIQPEICSLWAYAAAGFHNLLVVSARVRYPREAVKSALSLLGQGQTSLTKCVVLVDADIAPRDLFAVLRAIRGNFDPRQDLTLIERAPLDTLDFTSFQPHVGGKMILDATRKGDRSLPVSSTAPVVPSTLVQSLRQRGAVVTHARLVEGALLVAAVEGSGRPALGIVMSEAALLGAPLAAVVSPDVPLDDPDMLVWGIFTRFDPGLDVVVGKTSALPAQDIPSLPVLGIDATWKDGYPEPVAMRDDVVSLVSRRWKDYWEG